MTKGCGLARSLDRKEGNDYRQLGIGHDRFEEANGI
jgi:hypothetical protein